MIRCIDRCHALHSDSSSISGVPYRREAISARSAVLGADERARRRMAMLWHAAMQQWARMKLVLVRPSAVATSRSQLALLEVRVGKLASQDSPSRARECLPRWLRG